MRSVLFAWGKMGFCSREMDFKNAKELKKYSLFKKQIAVRGCFRGLQSIAAVKALCFCCLIKGLFDTGL